MHIYVCVCVVVRPSCVIPTPLSRTENSGGREGGRERERGKGGEFNQPCVKIAPEQRERERDANQREESKDEERL